MTLRQRPPNTNQDWIDPLFSPDSDLEFRFAHLWAELYPEIDLHHQHPICEERRYRFDFAHVSSKTAIEIQGGVFVNGLGHSSGKGITNDAEKIQLASSLGWVVIPVTGKQIEDSDVLERIKQTIEVRSADNAVLSA